MLWKIKVKNVSFKVKFPYYPKDYVINAKTIIKI